MDQVKSPANSLTIQSALVAMIVFGAQKLGLEIAETEVVTILGFVALVTAIYGRLRATKRVA